MWERGGDGEGGWRKGKSWMIHEGENLQLHQSRSSRKTCCCRCWPSNEHRDPNLQGLKVHAALIFSTLPLFFLFFLYHLLFFLTLGLFWTKPSRWMNVLLQCREGRSKDGLGVKVKPGCFLVNVQFQKTEITNDYFSYRLIEFICIAYLSNMAVQMLCNIS